jgi:hypothetical protein
VIAGMLERTDRTRNIGKGRDLAGARPEVCIQSPFDPATIVDKQGDATLEPIDPNGG